MRQLGRMESSSSNSGCSGATRAGATSSGPASSSSVPATDTSVSMSGAPEQGVHHVCAWPESFEGEAPGPPVVAARAPVVAPAPSAIKPAKINNFYAAVKAAVAAAKEAAVKEAAARSVGTLPVEAPPVPVMFDSGIFFMQGAVEVLMQPSSASRKSPPGGNDVPGSHIPLISSGQLFSVSSTPSGSRLQSASQVSGLSLTSEAAPLLPHPPTAKLASITPSSPSTEVVQGRFVRNASPRQSVVIDASALWANPLADSPTPVVRRRPSQAVSHCNTSCSVRDSTDNAQSYIDSLASASSSFSGSFSNKAGSRLQAALSMTRSSQQSDGGVTADDADSEEPLNSDGWETPEEPSGMEVRDAARRLRIDGVHTRKLIGAL
ncbi:MAG: hypothetical protein WDW36_007913 [Sanguina aurantia]